MRLFSLLFGLLISSSVLAEDAARLEAFCARLLEIHQVAKNASETRGFVNVPVDYADAKGPRLEIGYRMIGDPALPLLVMINGGPGMSSAWYRSYDYDDALAADQQESRFNKIAPLLPSFRVLLFDQRGTEGLSSRLNMSKVGDDYELVSKYFGSASIALDLDQVLSAVVQPGEEFIIVGQSYGGRILSQYVTSANRHGPSPLGVVYSSSAMPNYPIDSGFSVDRAKMQRKLNLQLLATVPDIKDKLAHLKEHLAKVGIDPEAVHNLFPLLGRGEEGVWEARLVQKVEELSTSSKSQIESIMRTFAGLADPLNYGLSSSELTPGKTDRTLMAELLIDVPIEPWMLSEEKALILAWGNEPWFNHYMDMLDAAPPSPTTVPSTAQMQASFLAIPSLMTFADQDSSVSPELMKTADTIYSNAERVMLPGGHSAIMSEAGRQTLTEWVERLKAKKAK